ncbi:hypothetical protein HMPREF0724_14521 [Prescottella equi ATCC 33707]|uniref:Uncharacterized protein n=1 Tax=Prescottella equi ATCC 33707 TaxID=525370 RepID=E9T6W5_RHOHA|nr:hypothetical protein HMPREF0724_14521 [Prescottella equi ATCC 33707]
MHAFVESDSTALSAVRVPRGGHEVRGYTDRRVGGPRREGSVGRRSAAVSELARSPDRYRRSRPCG